MVMNMEIPEPIKCDVDRCGGIPGLVKGLPKAQNFEKLSRMFRGLSDRYRLKILLILNRQPVCVCILKEILQIADSKLSYHLSTLKEQDIIYGKQEGNWIIYYPTDLGKQLSNIIDSSLLDFFGEDK
jgi:ArsR family transcriptional regulator